MEESRLDALSRAIASRRTVLGGLAAAAGVVAGSFTPGSLAKKKKKKKKKKCVGGAVRCGTACVDTQTDAQNCGSCGMRCGDGVGCAGGVCQTPGDTCPGAQTRCGGGCVDTKSNKAHCGACGRQCAANETCRQGTCSDSPCESNEIDCGGGRCIRAGEFACCNQYDCGGYGAINDLECRNDVCVCKEAGTGFCNRIAADGGRCHVCCPGGVGSAGCRFDTVCHTTVGGTGLTSYYCDCPTGWQKCNYNPHPTGTCVEHPLTDPRKCGPFCTDCVASQPGAICCGGACTRGPGIGEYSPENTKCGPHCEVCNSDSICCNQGPGTEPRCIPMKPGNGRWCYQNI
ncbi:MAG: hypothetical protein KC442_20345 [Thermomicrobiales bacterium]|nr:hypothetical protein [Thermomicrobiales bacterium]